MKVLSIFLNSCCNLNCKYCFTDAGASTKEQLTLGEYKTVIDQAKELGAKSVLVAGAGEPLLDDKLLPLIDYVSNKDMTFVFFTNNTLVTRELAEELYKKRVSVIAKCNSLDAETQDYLVGVNGAFDRIQEGLKNLVEAGFNKSSPTRLGLETVITRQNCSEIPVIVNYAIENNMVVIPETMICKGRAFKNREELYPNKEQLAETFNKVKEIVEQRFGDTKYLSYFTGDCKLHLYTIFIDQTGEVQQCLARDFKPIGNIRDEPLEKLWNSPSLKETRTFQESKCIDCFSKCAGREYFEKRAKNNLKSLCLKGTRSRLVRNNNGLLFASVYPDLKGVFKNNGEKTDYGVNLCTRLKTLGTNGFFTTDELPGYGISLEEKRTIMNQVGADEEDCVVLYAYDEETAKKCNEIVRNELADKNIKNTVREK